MSDLPVWNILCPGPSLADWRGKLLHVPHAPTVAINGALLEVDHFPIGYLSACDAPGHGREPGKKGRFGYLLPILEQVRPVIWTRTERLPAWRDFVKGIQPPLVFDAYPTISGLRKRVGWTRALNIGGKSVFYTLLNCMLKGAKELHVYGADMTGSGYHDERCYKAKQNWDARWGKEGKQMERLVAEAPQHGVQIHLHRP